MCLDPQVLHSAHHLPSESQCDIEPNLLRKPVYPDRLFKLFFCSRYEVLVNLGHPKPRFASFIQLLHPQSQILLMDNCPHSGLLPKFPNPQSQLQLVLEWNTSQPYSYEALTCANAFVFSHPTTNYYFDSQSWVKAFGKLPLLERVCVQRSAPLRHWFIKRWRPRNRKQLTLTSPFLNSAMSRHSIQVLCERS